VILLFRCCHDGYRGEISASRDPARLLRARCADENSGGRIVVCRLPSSTKPRRCVNRPRKMLTSSANQYLRPEYLTPLPTTVSSLVLHSFHTSSPSLPPSLLPPPSSPLRPPPYLQSPLFMCTCRPRSHRDLMTRAARVPP